MLCLVCVCVCVCVCLITVSICFQVFTGAYLAAVDFMNFMFTLFPVCGSKSKSKSGECAHVATPFAFLHLLGAHA